MLLSTRRQLELLRDLQQLANQRRQAEERIVREHREQTAKINANHKRTVDAAEQEYQAAREALETQHTATVDKLKRDYEHQRDQTQAEYRRAREQVSGKYRATVATAKETKQHAIWQALAVFDAAKNNPREQLAATQAQLAVRREELDQLQRDAQEILRLRRLWRASFESFNGQPVADHEPRLAGRTPSIDEATGELATRVEKTRAEVERLANQRATRFFEGATPLGMFLAVWLVLLVPLGFLVGWSNWPVWLAGSMAGAALVGGVGGWLWWRRSQSWAEATYQTIVDHLAAARGQIELAAAAAREQSRRHAQQLIETRDAELAAAEQQAATTLAEMETWKEEQTAEIGQSFPARLAELREAHRRDLATADEQYHRSLAEVNAKRERDLRTAETRRSEQLATIEAERSAAWAAMREAWFTGLAQIGDVLAEMQARCDRLFPDWNTTNYLSWSKPAAPAEAIQFGTATLDLAKVKHGLSPHGELVPDQTTFSLPTLITLREQPSLVATAEGEGRRQAVELLQTLMVRYLTAMPPGKVRLTICDPVSLGESFSSFMHLADHDEALIHGRIWSEPRDIDEQLTRLTGHMETILQKYLRNEYESIHEYNAHAGEVAEPFQVLAIANFPHGFSDTSAKRLLSLITGGPRCGVFVLLSLDKKQRLPSDFDADDLLAPSVHLDWDAERRKFVWRYPAFEQLPLQLPQPIGSDALVRLMKQAGKAAKESIRVEVPFSAVAPPEDRWWTNQCAGELAVPIGRAGANRLHYVRLGKGTSQHLLVAGKTGSGKSTFLHALVTSGAMHYSPQELEFYLVDFKKGVEFKAYATHALPHARVIAIESEREFGLSVLERLDQELRVRGEKFRLAGVQNLADYRRDHPDEAVPRVLLVIDEFQELFVEDDKLAQEAGLLLDRLVRQGRAFGMHVLLGSQTLSGAYSLARSTLGQMAVRVALQCSEADAHLILSDERNQAARFLSRPGEAIYNDQNGLVSANQPFQVVWLPDRERSAYLAKIDELRAARGLAERPAIVFEGNAPADPRDNVELMKRLRIADCGLRHEDSTPQSAIAWLGAAVAIKPPTSVTFARHGGSNLLVVGQQEAAALGVLTTAVISLAAGRPQGATFTILDGTRPGEPGEGVWENVATAIGESAELVDQRQVPAAIHRLATELARRDAENDESAPPWFVVIHNAARLRDLRKSEDDFSFSIDKDQPPAADKQLAEILKNGPPWGIHVLVWCDGYNAVTRLFDRLALREFEMRVCFQMSAADSSNLLDTPAASKLSPYRALLYNDETGEAEKFRPYGMPTDDWLGEVRDAIAPKVLEQKP